MTAFRHNLSVDLSNEGFEQVPTDIRSGDIAHPFAKNAKAFECALFRRTYTISTDLVCRFLQVVSTQIVYVISETKDNNIKAHLKKSIHSNVRELDSDISPTPLHFYRFGSDVEHVRTVQSAY